MLLGPVVDQLKGKRLLVVSDGALQYLPFGALPVPVHEGATSESVPLVVEHEVVSLPSASTIAVLRREAAERKAAMKTVAVLADPVFERDDPRLGGGVLGEAKAGKDRTGTRATLRAVTPLHRALRDIGFMQEGKLEIPRLPSTRWEADAIIAAAPSEGSFSAVDFQASRNLAMSPELGQYRIVHFATHGLLNNEHPELSGIILSMLDEQGQPQNGFLRLHDIYNLELPVDLVVLSACNSALGKQVRGEGLVGIVRGFMYAGAERVVASLWKVDDEATGELMKLFYREMLQKGLSPATALRQAQIAMWKETQWRSPFYWAAFVLQGEYL
jgi:CHAT domain-containing protein